MVYLLIRFDHHRGQTQLCDRQGGREGAKVVDMETNRDEGGYILSHAWDNAHNVI